MRTEIPEEVLKQRETVRKMNRVKTAESRSALLEIARSMTRNGQYNQAINQHTQLIKSYPDSLEAVESKSDLLELATFYKSQGRSHKAIGLYKTIADLA